MEQSKWVDGRMSNEYVHNTYKDTIRARASHGEVVMQYLKKAFYILSSILLLKSLSAQIIPSLKYHYVKFNTLLFTIFNMCAS